MKPKKETKNTAAKPETTKKEPAISIDDPLNSDSWKCVVLMAVERNIQDSFLLKELEEEASTQTRPKVQVLSCNELTGLISDFMKGEIRRKYEFLLNFSSLFREAGDYLGRQISIPLELWVKLIKAMLLYLREESFIRLDKELLGPNDPIQEMAERPLTLEPSLNKTRESIRMGDSKVRVRYPSVGKLHTQLLKRGEGVKENQWIFDAPANGYYSLYVLLIDFLNPDLPLKLLEADIPLHGLICVDTSLGMPQSQETSLTNFKSVSRGQDVKAEDILNFWSHFLKLLWSPDINNKFRDTICQMYTPRKLKCDKKQRRKFIYREISYLMYDMSGYKQHLIEYLKGMKIWDVEEKDFDMKGNNKLVIENLPSECVNGAVILQYMIEAISGNEFPIHYFYEFGNSYTVPPRDHTKYTSYSLLTAISSRLIDRAFSRQLIRKRDKHSMNVYVKTKLLDRLYYLDEMTVLDDLETSRNESDCHYQIINCAPNLQELLNSSGSVFRSLRLRYHCNVATPELDVILFPILMTRVFCSYQTVEPLTQSTTSKRKKNSDFELIENVDKRRPLFTATEGSRHILKSIPYNLKNISENFFSPEQFKIVTAEKLKASSEPIFRVAPPITVKKSFMSDAFPGYEDVTLKKDLLSPLPKFSKDDVIANINNFYYLEFLTKANLLKAENELDAKYNCIDHTYSLLHDGVFIAVHKRVDNQSTLHETFNEVLRTVVGLRDFYSYILEDEAERFKTEAEKSVDVQSLSGKTFQKNCFEFTDSDFWITDSIKDQFWKKGKKHVTSFEENPNHQLDVKTLNKDFQATEEKEENNYAFEGYNVSDSIVQFSGLKTIFYADECSVSAELIERLYGDQVLGVHICIAKHNIYLYSYACPQPHVDEPYMFHVVCKNGAVLAFSRLKSFAKEDSKVVVSSSSDWIFRREIFKMDNVEEKKTFDFNMSASLPNGLMIQTVGSVRPCYIRQRILEHSSEAKRLFLSNGNVVKFVKDGKIEIFKTDTSLITADLDEFLDNFSKYEIIMGDGLATVIENGMVTSSKRFQIFQNMDMTTGNIYFRRRDGTNFVLQYDGSLCAKFKDNTKLCSTPYMKEPLRDLTVTSEGASVSNDDETEIEDVYVIIYLEVTFEHPDYATAIYNTHNKEWKVLLPSDMEITIFPAGDYFIKIDKQSELVVEETCIQASRYSSQEELLFRATADLTVFEVANKVYVSAKDYMGKTFVVEPNSNCYVEQERLSEGERLLQSHLLDTTFTNKYDVSMGTSYGTSVETTATCIDTPVETSKQPPFGTSFEIPIETPKPSACLLNTGNILDPDNRYFVVKKDLAGYELLHKNAVTKAVTNLKKGQVVFTQTFPNSCLRCFVLISPELPKSFRKWEVKSILPEPKYSPNSTTRTTSSTYGDPPSWLHPFPKKKYKYQIPESFSCRVFLEVKPTGLVVGPNKVDCTFCEMEEIKPKLTLVSLSKMEDYLQSVSNNDQSILREMYSLVVGGIINQKKKKQPHTSKKLENYLQMSKYFLRLQERDKDAIRYCKIPNFFLSHPVGISWTILNGHIDTLKLPEKDSHSFEQTLPASDTISCSTSSTSQSIEQEYNLNIKICQSFSDLSYHSSKSGRTAPSLIETQGICKCKVKPTKGSISFPAINFDWKSKPLFFEEEGKKSQSPLIARINSEHDPELKDDNRNDLIEFQPRICDFSDSDYYLFDKQSLERKNKNCTKTLKDLMLLGLV